MALLLLVAGLSFSAAAPAQPAEARHKAVTHYRQAEAYMKAEAFEQAAGEYLAAYEAVPKAAFLFNAGLAWESAGEKRKAVEHYRRYLEADPKGKAVEEAKARAAKLQTVIDAEDEAAAEAERQRQEAEQSILLAESHAEAARKLVEAEQYDAAIAELRTAYGTHPEPSYLFRLGQAYQLAGELTYALAQFELYREVAPTGPHAADAIVQINVIENKMAEANKPKPAPPPPPTKPVPADAPEAEEEDEGVNWWWFSIGAALVAGGLVADLAPNSARNSSFDGTDVIPLPLYAVGGTFMVIGVF